MSNKTSLQTNNTRLSTNNTDLSSILSKINNLPITEEISLQEKTINPTTSSQTITADSNYDGLSSVSISAVDSSIDDNIVASNIKSGVSILGVEGTFGGSSDVVSGSFTPTENYTSEDQYFEVDLGFTPSAVFVYRKVWESGTQSINATFRSDYFSYSICNTASSSKAVEKLVGGSYITISDTGFKVTGDSTYYLVGGSEYIYVAFKEVGDNLYNSIG